MKSRTRFTSTWYSSILLLLLFFQPFACHQATGSLLAQYRQQAARVTIIRDSWGVPHVYGKTDVDAVFGVMYAQCEDGFERVERAYIERLGRLAEIEGEAQLSNDLQTRLIYDSSAAIADYHKSPAWLQKLLQAFANGVNYYIAQHPEKPVLLSHFEPWFPLLFTDGGYTATQMGGIQPEDVERLYPLTKNSNSFIHKNAFPAPPTGSNGFAIAPAKSASENALLYINPHVSFYFRTEMQMASEEGLNAYGAVTWGQFFVFQGFNENCGWMHTSSQADAADVYEEKVSQQGDELVYEYDGNKKKLTTRQQVLNYLKDGNIQPVKMTTYATNHGPVMGKRGDKWLSLKEQNRSMNGLIQSWQRTKAASFEAFQKTLQLRANNSTNTLYADRQGTIAYWHGNFIPVRDIGYDWALPVDGSTPATDWKGIHALDDIVHIINPPQGFLQNCNSTPFSAAGFHTVNSKSYPAYMAPDGENFRSLLAIKELEKENGFTMDKLTALGYNTYLSAFDTLLPPLFKAYDALPETDAAKQLLKEPITVLKSWDKRSSVSSIATTLAVEWGITFLQYHYQNLSSEPEANQAILFASFAKKTSAGQLLTMLSNVVQELNKYYGNWKIPWGEITRYQRNASASNQPFDDSKESFPVGLGSSIFGSLPSFETTWRGTKKGYGTAGNSFVAVVEFGAKIRARSIVTGGQSCQPNSNHFTDQAQGYINGRFKEVFFYKNDVLHHAERSYHPGK